MGLCMSVLESDESWIFCRGLIRQKASMSEASSRVTAHMYHFVEDMLQTSNASPIFRGIYRRLWRPLLDCKFRGLLLP